VLVRDAFSTFQQWLVLLDGDEGHVVVILIVIRSLSSRPVDLGLRVPGNGVLLVCHQTLGLSVATYYYCLVPRTSDKSHCVIVSVLDPSIKIRY
jgi:hypothetical protein